MLSNIRRIPSPSRFALLAFFIAALCEPADVDAIDCPRSMLNQFEEQIRPVPAEQMVPTHQPGAAMGPPADPNVGDSWIWYTWLLGGFPAAEEKLCTVRGEGDNVYIVVEDSQWLTNVDQTDIDTMLERWDNSSVGEYPDMGIYDIVSENFGPVPDQLDNDPKVYVLYYDFDISADGFFWAFDMFPDGTQDFASNETEVLYMNSSDNDPGGDFLISVQAHEFEHMVHWLADANELSWVDEGLAELAMWLFGFPDPIVSFPNNPDNNLTSWGSGFADYIKTYLWSLYFYEKYGGQPTILDLVAQPSNSWTGVNLVLANQGYSEQFPDVLEDWTTANFLDDSTLETGQYGYEGAELPNFNAIVKSSYPVPTTNATVNSFAADYVRFTNGVSQRLFFDGGDTSTWTIRILKYLAGEALSVEEMTLDGDDAGSFALPGFGSSYDEVVMAVIRTSPTGANGYSYWTEQDPASVDPSDPAVTALSLGILGASPSLGPIDLELAAPSGSDVRVTLHDAAGRQISSLFEGRAAEGRTVRVDPAQLPGSGVYLARAVDSAGRVAVQRLVFID